MRGFLLALGICDPGPKRKSVTSGLQPVTKDADQEKTLSLASWKVLILTNPQEGCVCVCARALGNEPGFKILSYR